jgi:hypothetical protein
MTRLVDLAQYLVLAATFPAVAYVLFRALTDL